MLIITLHLGLAEYIISSPPHRYSPENSIECCSQLNVGTFRYFEKEEKMRD